MAVDEAIASAVERGLSPPTLRLYGWKSPVLSLGYFQKADKCIDTVYCLREGIDIVLRPTGGRSVLHDKEVTYSIASPRDNPTFCPPLAKCGGGEVADNILHTYKVISSALVKGLSLLKINASISTFRTPHSSLQTPSCFATTSRYEIVVNGKKLVGSAQRRFKNSFLQHGSIPLYNCHNKFALCLGFKEKNKRKNFINLINKKSTAINELNGRIYSYDEVENAAIKGFEDILRITFSPASLTKYELELAKKLYEKKRVFQT